MYREINILAKVTPGTYVEGNVMFFIPLNEKPAKMIKVCSEVDKLVDVEPPLIRNIDFSWSGDERVWRNFGFPDLLPALKGKAFSCKTAP